MTAICCCDAANLIGLISETNNKISVRWSVSHKALLGLMFLVIFLCFRKVSECLRFSKKPLYLVWIEVWLQNCNTSQSYTFCNILRHNQKEVKATQQFYKGAFTTNKYSVSATFNTLGVWPLSSQVFGDLTLSCSFDSVLNVSPYLLWTALTVLFLETQLSRRMKCHKVSLHICMQICLQHQYGVQGWH